MSGEPKKVPNPLGKYKPGDCVTIEIDGKKVSEHGIFMVQSINSEYVIISVSGTYSISPCIWFKISLDYAYKFIFDSKKSRYISKMETMIPLHIYTIHSDGIITYV